GRLLQEISVGPLQAMIPMLFHDACAGYSKLALRLLDVLIAVERAHPLSAPPSTGPAQCIYCLTLEGDFGSEEHVIPESLGGDAMVLRDSVCRRCNNTLARLDQTLLE